MSERKEAAQMICKWTRKPCDPKGKHCEYLDRTFKNSLNETCEHICSEVMAKAEEEAEG